MPFCNDNVRVFKPVQHTATMPTSVTSSRRTCVDNYSKYPTYTPKFTGCRHSSLDRSSTRTFTSLTYKPYLSAGVPDYCSVTSRPPKPTKPDLRSSISSSSAATDARGSLLRYNYSDASARCLASRSSAVKKDRLESPSRYRDLNETRESRCPLRERSEMCKGWRSRDSSVTSRDSSFLSSSSRERSSSRDFSTGSSAFSNGCFDHSKTQHYSLDSGQSRYQSSTSALRERKTPPVESTSSRFSASEKHRSFQKQKSEPANIQCTSTTAASLSQTREITGSRKTIGGGGRTDAVDNLHTPSRDYVRSEVTINGNISLQGSDDDADDSGNDDGDNNGNKVYVTELCRRYDANKNLQKGKSGVEKSSFESDEDAQSTSSGSSGSDSSCSSRRASPKKEISKDVTVVAAAGNTTKKVLSAVPTHGGRETQGITSQISRLGTSSPSSSDASDYSPRSRRNDLVNGTAPAGSESPVIPPSTRQDWWVHRDVAISNGGGLVGLRNLGNTCFMNSVLQCLSNTRLLLEYMRREEYMSDINNTVSSMKGQLIKAFRDVIVDLWKEDPDEKVVNTTSFKSQIQRFAPRFMGYNQQDAQEFLRYLLEGLHEDVNRVISKPKPLTTDIDDDLSEFQKATESWKRYLRHDNSKIVDIFVGQLKSTLKCTVCGHCSVTFDPFWDLSLPIPNRTGQVRLQQCFDLFTKEEVLDGDEKPTCSRCQCRRKCTKSFSIQKFPKILVLHLKRFSPLERFRGKLKCTVDFPLAGLDLTTYAANKSHECTYNLYGVCNHSGTTYSGHYTAYCKHPYSREWHEYNDSRVHAVSSHNVVSSEAYVLFYELNVHCSHL